MWGGVRGSKADGPGKLNRTAKGRTQPWVLAHPGHCHAAPDRGAAENLTETRAPRRIARVTTCEATPHTVWNLGPPQGDHRKVTTSVFR